MTSKVLEGILTKRGGCRQEGDAILVPAAIDATMFVAFANQSIAIERIERVEIENDTVTASTTRGERFVVVADDIRALRFASNESATGYR